MNIELLLFGVIIAVFLIDFLKKGMKKRNDSNELIKVEDNEDQNQKKYKFILYVYAFLGSVVIGVLGTYLIYCYYRGDINIIASFTDSLYNDTIHITNFFFLFALTFAILSYISFGKTRFFKYLSSRKKNVILSILSVIVLKVIIHYLFYPLKSKITRKILKQSASQRFSRVRTRGGSRDGENTFSYITETINTDLGEYIISSKNGELTLFTEMPLLFIPSLILFLVIIWLFNDKIKAR